MTFLRIFAVAGLSLSLATAPAMAGNTSLSSSNGTQLKIKCKNSGCTVRAKPAGGKWGVVEKTAGGRKNHDKLVAKYRGMGYNY
ncbi:MAG: hypothetical protein RID23_04350 [Roseovarius sp.]